MACTRAQRHASQGRKAPKSHSYPILGLTSTIKGLILSGGLAQQEYLKDQLLEKLRQKIDRNLDIIPEISQDSYVPHLLCDAI